jgi:ATP-dependent 26S proteasome regulatory subunit
MITFLSIFSIILIICLCISVQFTKYYKEALEKQEEINNKLHKEHNKSFQAEQREFERRIKCWEKECKDLEEQIKNPTGNISLMSMLDAVGKIAKKYNENYYYIEVNIHSRKGINITGYINGFALHQGVTIEEVCNKLEAVKNPPKSPYLNILLK